MIATNDSATLCWVVTDGKAGMENQCLGLAESLGLTPVIKRVKLRSPWKQLSPFLRHGLQWAFSTEGDTIAPPWPDLLIATGRASVPASLYARRAARMAGGRGILTVQIQNPVIDTSRFDLVVVPRHDGMMGAHVMTTRGALHRLSLERLKAEASEFLPQVATLPAPRIAVLIGGANSVYQMTPREVDAFARQLSACVKQSGGSLMVTPSRRTGEDNLAALKEGLQGVPAYVWDGKGANPYFGMLGVADTIVATCDSVNMVSEACFTGKPVYVIQLPGGSDKFRRFHQSLQDDGYTRIFNGTLETWSYPPLDDMRLVADRVREMLAARKRKLA